MTLPRPTLLLCHGTALFGLGLLALTLAARVAFPWPLEWMEGASLAHALRLATGEPLYAAPSAEHVAFLYPPLAYLPMALSAKLFGASLLSARLPSVLFLCASLLLLGRAASALTGQRAFGWLAAGLYALGFGYTGSFLDLARVDALFMLLLIAGAERGVARAYLAALACFVAAALAKQHGLLFLLAASAWLLRDHRAAVTGAWAALAAWGLCLQWLSGGWFWFYAVQVPRGHGVIPTLLASYLLVDVLCYLPALAVLSLLDLRARARAPRLLDVLLLAGLLASALGRAHPGGDDNVRLPGFALLVLAGVAGYAARPNRRLLHAALVVQAVMLAQLPSAHAPPPQLAPAFAQLTAALRRCGGDGAVALDHTLLTPRSLAHTMALSDVRAGPHAGVSRAATAALLQRLAGPRAPAAVAVSATFPELSRALQRDYQPCADVPRLPLPTGYRPGPTRVYRRRDHVP